MLHTIEFEPDHGRDHDPHPVRGAEDQDASRPSWSTSAPAYGQALQSGIPSLVAQLEAERADREADRGPEPELAEPRAHGRQGGRIDESVKSG